MTTDAEPVPDGPFRARPGVIVTDLEDELVLLDPDTQEMHSLGKTGRAVWRALPAQDLAALARVLRDGFQVDAEQARIDVEAFLAELIEAGLVEAGEPGAAD